jgi:mevalonate pyrophosphate decarboxylase
MLAYFIKFWGVALKKKNKVIYYSISLNDEKTEFLKNIRTTKIKTNQKENYILIKI